MNHNKLTQKITDFLEKNKGTKKVPCFDLDLINYNTAYNIQLCVFELVKTGYAPGVILLLEHSPVITIGNNRSRNNLLAGEENLKAQGIELVQSNRGGDITFHGPGQLVCYPIFNLNYFDKDLTQFVKNLEQIIIDTLIEYKIKGTRIDKFRGVFVDNYKIASIGLHVKKWVTMHGFSFNININLDYFKNIIACGLKNHAQTSLKKILNHNVSISDVKEQVLEKFAEIFNIKILKIK
ncbi:MAG: lipoyl(octanoyl) transferase LipB [Actinobacteria bacterium]|nr:lipoyl(octanoyl) transferase LipB [Actinomycetota bacterium]MBM3713846.1 lipoyl(octanoyl) transferase LipB [Actinomycetota bacterium]